MAKKEIIKELNAAHKRFCEEYIFDFNGTRAYQVAYPDASYESAGASAPRLLGNVRIKAYIKYLQDNLAEVSGLTKLRVLKEYEKLAFSSIAHLHNTWIERKAFEELTEDQKACIAEIQTQTRTMLIGEDMPVEIEYVKIKLYDKQKALENISKMLGYNEPDKLHMTGSVIKVKFDGSDEENI